MVEAGNRNFPFFTKIEDVRERERERERERGFLRLITEHVEEKGMKNFRFIFCISRLCNRGISMLVS